MKYNVICFVFCMILSFITNLFSSYGSVYTTKLYLFFAGFFLLYLYAGFFCVAYLSVDCIFVWQRSLLLVSIIIICWSVVISCICNILICMTCLKCKQLVMLNLFHTVV